jgi:hypothetical protein
MAYNTKINDMETKIDDWKDDFEAWFKSDNVFKEESSADPGKYVYRTQCTLWKRAFTKKELKKYFKKEYSI